MKRIILVTITLGMMAALFLLPNVKVGCACDCAIENDYEKALEKSDIVFDGYVTNKKSPRADLFGITSSASLVRWSFEVNGSWKGEVPEKYDVYSAQSGASCGYEFEVGKRYIVFGYMDDNDKLIVSLCSSTRVLTDQSIVHDQLSSYKGTVILEESSDKSEIERETQVGTEQISPGNDISSSTPIKVVIFVGLALFLAIMFAGLLIVRYKNSKR